MRTRRLLQGSRPEGREARRLHSPLRARRLPRGARRPSARVGRRLSDGGRNIFASWLDRPLRDISREKVEERLREIAKEVTKRSGRGSGAASANGTMRALRVLYNFAADRAPPSNPMPPNPVRLRKMWLPVAARTRHVTEAELPKFYKAVTELPSEVARDYLLLILFTGFRRNEAAALRWEEIDLNARVIRLPAARAKAGQQARPADDRHRPRPTRRAAIDR